MTHPDTLTIPRAVVEQAAHQEMREALYAEFNSAVGRQHD